MEVKGKKLSAKGKPGKRSKSSGKQQEQIVDWIQCEDCYKWRKIPEGERVENLKKNRFVCRVLQRYSCLTEEERWRRQYTTLSIKHN